MIQFADEQACIDYMVAKRWPTGLVCPTCGSTAVGFLENQKRFHCGNRHPNHAIRPWYHRSWIFPRDPDFAGKAGRILDL